MDGYKRFPTTLILINAILIILGIGTYLYFRSERNVSTLFDTPQQTYTDQIHGFSVNYPATLTVNETTDEGLIVITNYPYNQETRKTPIPDEIKISVAVGENPRRLSAREFYNSMPYSVDEKIISERPLTVDSLEAREYTIVEVVGKFRQVYVPYQNKMYIITDLNETDQFETFLGSFQIFNM